MSDEYAMAKHLRYERDEARKAHHEAVQRAEQAEYMRDLNYRYYCEAKMQEDQARQEAARLREALIALRDDGQWIGGQWAPSDKAEQKAEAALQSAPPASEPVCDACDDYGEIYIDDKRMECPNCADPAPADRPEPSEALPKDWRGMDAVDRLVAFASINADQETCEFITSDEDVIRRHLSQPAPAVPEHWSHKKPGLADQYRAEALACRRALGFSEASENVSPSDITQALAAQPSESPAVPDAALRRACEAALNALDNNPSPIDARKIARGALRRGLVAAPTPTDGEK